MDNLVKKFIITLFVSLLVCAQAQAMDNQKQLDKQLADAIASSQGSKVKQLIDAKADVNYGSENILGYRVLARATVFPSCLRQLIKAKAEINFADAAGGTALLFATAYGPLESIQALIKANAKINHETNRGETPLKCAVKRKDTPICDALIEALLHMPSNKAQRQNLITLFGIDTYRCALSKFGFYKDIRHELYKALRHAIYCHNIQDFKNSLAYQELDKLEDDNPRKKALLEKYLKKSKATNEGRRK